ncbi:MAG: carboxypeptidase regulatory-like domain-containing protein, partial [Myxococcaceae bacterium]
MKFRIALALVLASALSACDLDLSLPDRPQRGKVTGSIDTGGHINNVGLDVTLVSEDGTRTKQPTDDKGAFVIGDLAPGVYFVDLALPGFAPFIRPNVRVKAGATADLGALAPTWLQNTPLEATLSGKVVVANGSGSPAGGQIEFVLEGADQKIALVGISESGDFVQRLPPGSYTLRVTHPLYVSAIVSNITLAAAETKDLGGSPIVLDVNPATLSGKILRERDGLAPVPANGVTLTPDLGAPTTTDQNGQFQLTGLAAGPRSVRINLTGYHDAEGSHAIILQPGQSSTLPDITLQLDRGAISGQVKMADLQPVRDTTLSIAGTPYGAVVSPDAADPSKGTFKISGVPVGTYDVIATKARYSKAVAGSVTVTADGTVDVGTLTLTLLQGDFDIDDGDNTNTAGYTKSRSVTLKLNGFTGAATFRASEDPNFTNVAFVAFTGSSQPYTITGAGDGTKTVYAQYVDGSGTTSPTFTSSVVLDTVAPAQPSITINGGAAFTQANQVLNVTLTATDTRAPDVDAVSGLSKVKLAETAAGLTTATAQTYARDTIFTRPTSTDGPQTVFAQFIDNAGNASTPVSSTIVVDTAAPSGSISIAKGAKATSNGYTNSALVTLSETAAAEPNGGYVLIRLANSQADLASSVFTPVRSSGAWFIDPVGEGQKTVYAELQDAAGNSSGTITASIIYDTTPPSPATASLIGSSPVKSLSVTLALNAADTNGLSTTEGLTLSEDPFFQSTGTTTPTAYPVSAQVTFNPLSSGDGPKQLYVRYRDVAGNDSLATVDFTLDRTPPSGSIVITGSLADGTPSSSITSSLAVSVTLTQSGASQYQIGNEALTDCSTGTYLALPSSSTLPTFTLSSSGQVRVCLKDTAGNVTATPIAGSITVDSTAPTGCTLTASGTRTNGQVAPANITADPNVLAGLSCPSELPKEIVVGGGATALNCASSSLAWQPWT